MAQTKTTRPRPVGPGTGSRPRPETSGALSRRRLAAFTAAAVVVLATVAAFAFAPSPGSGEAGLSAEQEAFVLPGLLDDANVSLAEHAGRPVVVNFFASWCVYCNEELPGFVEVAKATRGQVKFIGVDTYDTGDGAAMARRFDLADAGFALARDIGPEPGSELWTSFGGQGLPVTAFYDAQGNLVDYSGGMLTQGQLEERIEANFDVEVDAADAAARQSPVIPLIPQGAVELLASNAENPDWVALDVRTPEEFTAGHLPAASNIDFYAADFADQLEDLDKDRNYVVYCQSGNRSGQATALMHDLGFKHVYEISGGMNAWQSLNLPIAR